MSTTTTSGTPPSPPAPPGDDLLRNSDIPPGKGGRIGNFLKEKWPELVVVALLGWALIEIYGLNRESGVDDTKVASLDKNITEFKNDNAKRFDDLKNQITIGQSDIKNQIAGIQNDVKVLSDLKQDVKAVADLKEELKGLSDLKGDVKVVKANVDDLKTSARDLSASIKDVQLKLAAEARDALWQEFGKMRSAIQFGKFNDDTRNRELPLAFQWKLEHPVNPSHVLFVVATTQQSLPGLEISAEITDKGTRCQMSVKGTNPDSLRKLMEGIDAQVFIFAEPTDR